MAKRKINDVAKVYIDSKRDQLTPAELSKILGITPKSIQDYLNENPVEVATPKEAQPHTTESKQPQNEGPEPIRPQFINRTMNGNAGISICTPQASELSDEIRKNRNSKNGMKFKDCTTKIRK